MPNNSPLTIKDGKSTPADHVFAPVRIDSKGLALFNENTGSSLIGRPTLSYTVSGGTGGAAYKVALQINVPKVVNVTDGNGIQRDVIQHQPLAKTEFVFQSTTSAAERKDVRVLMANALLHATLGPAIDNVESFW